MLNLGINIEKNIEKVAWPRPAEMSDVWFECGIHKEETPIFATNAVGSNFITTNILKGCLEPSYEFGYSQGPSLKIEPNASGTISGFSILPDELQVVFACSQNICGQSWMAELDKMRPPRLTFAGQPTATGVVLRARPLASKITKPPLWSKRKEVEWLSSNVEALKVYEGNWIAVQDDRIVAWGSDEIDVEMQARLKGAKEPLLFRVPSKKDKPFIG